MKIPTLEEIKAELEKERQQRLISQFKLDLELGNIKTVSLNKKYKELKESLAQNQE